MSEIQQFYFPTLTNLFRCPEQQFNVKCDTLLGFTKVNIEFKDENLARFKRSFQNQKVFSNQSEQAVMQLLQCSQTNSETGHQKLIESIRSSISELSQSTELQNWVCLQEQGYKIHQVTKISIKQLKQEMKLLWSFKILNHVMIVKVCLLQQQRISEQIKQLCRKQREKVILYFNHVNNTCFGLNQGQFCLHGAYKILFQYREDNWYALKNPFKLKLHLTRKLKRINQTFKKIFQSFLIKFKLLPNAHAQKEQREKEQILSKIKQFFQQNKHNPQYPAQLYNNIIKWRKHTTSIDFTSPMSKLDESILMLIQGKSPRASQGQSPKNTFNNTVQKISDYEQLKCRFKNKALAYNIFNDCNMHIPQPIVVAMEVLQVKNQKTFKGEGGYGKFTRGLYTCKYSKTIYYHINKELQSQVCFSEQIFTRYLCKKSSLQKKCPSFQNQKLALIKLRNKQSPHIAQYYCDISKGKPFDQNNIYMDVYTNNIDQTPTNLKQKFKILMEMIKGVSFLNVNGILHRDLKLENVMVDRQMNSRIIDLGSCGNVYQREDLFKPYDNKLRSTDGYFVKYQQYLNSLPIRKPSVAMSQQQFYQHYFFDIYSFGKIIEKLFNLQDYQFVKEDFLMSQLFYLKQKCTQLNPADRLAHQEIQFFIETLLDMEKKDIG